MQANVTIFTELLAGDFLEEFKQQCWTYLISAKQELINYLNETSQHLGIFYVVYLILSLILYYCLAYHYFGRKELPNVERVLFVTAHPDDECMFFGPTIVKLCQRKARLHLLCLTKGNYRNEGALRKEELYESCSVLGITEPNITLLSCTCLPDDPTVRWRDDIVANILLNHIKAYSIDTVITFDKHGVSNHQNHISIFYALAYLCLEKKLPEDCKAYALESVNIIRKYTICLDTILSYCLSSYVYVSSSSDRLIIRKAMEAHVSQYVWFRQLYMIFSRYVFMNTLKEIDIFDLELDLELLGD